MTNHKSIQCVFAIALLILCSRAFAQPGNRNFGKVWMHGASLTYTTTFNGGQQPINQILFQQQVLPPYLDGGHSNICDSIGNVIIVSDGFNLYNKNLQYLDGGKQLVPQELYGMYPYSFGSQTSLILPFGNKRYRLITPTVSDDSCIYNWKQTHNGAVFDLLLYDEIDMNANGGAGKVTTRMEPLLQNVRLSKTQMMACRHGDGISWWLLKQAADTNLVYKFLLTDNRIYGPYIQGFSGAAAKFTGQDLAGQSMFSKDGTKYATTILGYGNVFVADFDRCSGNLSNPRVYKVPAELTGNPFDPLEKDSTTTGVVFSPNGRYLYVSSFYSVHQLDLQNTSSPSAWTKLYGIDTTWDNFQLYSTIYPAPDDKLYIGNWNGFAGQMSVIDAPDNGGAAAGFCRKCLRFPGFLYDTTFVFVGVDAPPCMPNYALGAISPKCAPAGFYQPVSKEAQFHLYPNPAKETMEVLYEETGTLLLYDMAGRMMYSWYLPASLSGKKSIELGGLSEGVYQYKYVLEHKGSVIGGKLVIAR